MSKSILAFSSSRAGNSGFLENAAPVIDHFLNGKQTKIAFISFASVDNDFENYTSLVREALKEFDFIIRAVVPENAKEVISNSDVIMVGGGNTFKLIHDIYSLDLFDLIQAKVNSGTPYIGWSAGSNILGLTIGTTNDMPIIEPKSFKAFGLLPFQINPHYVNQKDEKFNGETRDQRLEEFVKLNPGIPVVCLPEGSYLQLQNEKLTYCGSPGVLFEPYKIETNIARKIIEPGTNLNYLL
jgi:dipeptidase E